MTEKPSSLTGVALQNVQATTITIGPVTVQSIRQLPAAAPYTAPPAPAALRPPPSSRP